MPWQNSAFEQGARVILGLLLHRRYPFLSATWRQPVGTTERPHANARRLISRTWKLKIDGSLGLNAVDNATSTNGSFCEIRNRLETKWAAAKCIDLDLDSPRCFCSVGCPSADDVPQVQQVNSVAAFAGNRKRDRSFFFSVIVFRRCLGS